MSNTKCGNQGLLADCGKDLYHGGPCVTAREMEDAHAVRDIPFIHLVLETDEGVANALNLTPGEVNTGKSEDACYYGELGTCTVLVTWHESQRKWTYTRFNHVMS